MVVKGDDEGTRNVDRRPKSNPEKFPRSSFLAPHGRRSPFRISDYILGVPPVLPPYAVPPVHFPFRALAARAGRAPLGGEREVALAALMVARLARDAVGENELPIALRAERAAAARAWLASLALPARARSPLTRLLEASAGDVTTLAAAIDDAATALVPWLDDHCIAELRAITARPLVNSR
jgi:hypothetical protein